MVIKMFLKIKSEDLWRFLPVLFFIFFISPVAIVLSSLFGQYSENWSHLYNYVLSDYVINSFLLITGVSILTSLIGIITSWLVTNFNFSGKKFFEWALILPLSVPPYILAYTYTGLFDASGSANTFLIEIFNLDKSTIIFPNIRNIYGAVMVFSFTLYPYVYLICRMAFVNHSKSIIESGRVLGLSRIGAFFNLSIPLIRPAIIAGLALVIMETLSDFGAVDHFAISTFTTGIFRTWYGMYDLETAMQLASFLLIFITIILFTERISRRKMSFTFENSLYKKTDILKLRGIKNFSAFVICFLPIFMGFLLPIIELINWSISYNLDFFNSKFIKTSMNSIILAFVAALLCSMFALIINYSIRFLKNSFLSFLSSSLSLGYAFPGLILAVGIIQLLTFVDSLLITQSLGLILTGSILGLIIAYIIKSYAMASSTIDSSYQRISTYVDDVSKTLGITGWKMLFKIHFPLIKTGVLTSALLVISEVIKELPATLILRPFNFDTLAVSAYIYASEERMFEAAAPSIAIVMVGLLPIYFLSRMIRESRPGASIW
tara:strand:- start:4145 stop:5788 length:1644 start_codon:yes stop_codon:yes gene_type:complete